MGSAAFLPCCADPYDDSGTCDPTCTPGVSTGAPSNGSTNTNWTAIFSGLTGLASTTIQSIEAPSIVAPSGLAGSYSSATPYPITNSVGQIVGYSATPTNSLSTTNWGKILLYVALALGALFLISERPRR